MKIQNSYIFMKKKPFKQQSESLKDKSKEVTSFIGRNIIYSFIREEFPDIVKNLIQTIFLEKNTVLLLNLTPLKVISLLL